MRPIRLEISAFGPYASTQSIDFRLLGDQDFFLIHGPTGAGKTSILDAMCFGLYGETTGDERTGSQMRSQFAAADAPTEVTFDFALGDEVYRVRRTPRQTRPSRRGGGTTEDQPTATLWCRTGVGPDAEDGKCVASKLSEVNSKVAALLGFSVKQFRQVVMLPQGRFRELLRSGSKEREAILEQLFATSHFRGLEERLKERRKELRAELGECDTKIAEVFRGLDTPDDAALDASTGEAAANLASVSARFDEARVAAEAAARSLSKARSDGALLEVREKAVVERQRAQDALDAARAAAKSAVEAHEVEKARAPERAAADAEHRRLVGMREPVGDLEECRTEARAAARALAAAKAAVEAARREVESAERAVVVAQGRVADVSSATSALSGADASVAALERSADGRRRLDDLAREVEAAEEALVRADARHASAVKDAHVARERRTGLERLWAEGQAAVLAGDLEDGAACPVCGSTTHPRLAQPAPGAPAPAEVDAARAAAEAADEHVSAVDAERTRAHGVREAACARRDTLVAELGSDAEGDAAALEAALVQARAHRDGILGMIVAADSASAELATAEADLVLRRTELDKAAHALSVASTAEAMAQHSCDAVESRVPDELRPPGALEAAISAANETVDALASALEVAREAEHSTAVAVAGTEATVKAAEERLAEAESGAKGVSAPDLDALESVARLTGEERDAIGKERGSVEERCRTLEAGRSRISALREQYADADERYGVVARLAEVATGDNPRNISFQRYALGIYLDHVLESANRRLRGMSAGRYRLLLARGIADGRSAAGLELEVFDEYTGGNRSVDTLSGGEGFTASLSLALGLAETVQSLSGGVRLDTVLVDEGFGSLDDRSLDDAIGTLMGLGVEGDQGRERRLVGVISHVPELRERIPCRLEITKTEEGSSARFVVP